MTAENITLKDFEDTEEGRVYDIKSVTEDEIMSVVDVIMGFLALGSVPDDILDNLVGFSLKVFEAKEATGYEFSDEFNAIREDLKRRTGRS